MTAARLFAASLLLASLPAGATGFIQVFTEPFAPVDGYPTRLVFVDPFEVVITTSPPLVQREGNTIRVTANGSNCVITCPPDTSVFAAHLGLLPAGDYTVELWTVWAGAEFYPPYLLDSFPLSVAAGPRIHFSPADPSEGEEVVLRLENVVGHCPHAEPPRIVGNRIEAPIELGLCPPPEAPHTLEIPLGPLAAGSYDVVVASTQYLARGELEVVPAAALLQNGRFEVVASWENAAGDTGPGRLVQMPSNDSALFYFFSRDNWELMVKVLDGCAINGFYWVFAAASTDVEYRATVREIGGPRTFEFGNSLGSPAAAVTSINAFSCP